MKNVKKNIKRLTSKNLTLEDRMSRREENKRYISINFVWVDTILVRPFKWSFVSCSSLFLCLYYVCKLEAREYTNTSFYFIPPWYFYSQKFRSIVRNIWSFHRFRTFEFISQVSRNVDRIFCFKINIYSLRVQIIPNKCIWNRLLTN